MAARREAGPDVHVVGETLRIPKMAELISEALRRQIVRGEFQEGDALPSEVTLMEQFGVSRPTLREAFRVLESEALIEIRRGARGGARVKGPDSAIAARYVGFILEHDGATLRDVFNARSVIESECARLAARNRTDDDIAELQAIYDQISASPDVATRIKGHGRFDVAVVRTSKNATLAVLANTVRSIIDRSTSEAVLKTADSSETIDAYMEAHKAHKRLIELVKKRDEKRAADHWRRHLDLAEAFVLSAVGGEHSVLDLM